MEFGTPRNAETVDSFGVLGKAKSRLKSALSATASAASSWEHRGHSRASQRPRDWLQ